MARFLAGLGLLVSTLLLFVGIAGAGDRYCAELVASMPIIWAASLIALAISGVRPTGRGRP